MQQALAALSAIATLSTSADIRIPETEIAKKWKIN